MGSMESVAELCEVLEQFAAQAGLDVLIYAHADTEMKRHALEKANSATTHSPLPAPLWHDREDIIQRLCGLKE